MRKLLGIFLATLSITIPAANQVVTADSADEGAVERPPSTTAQIGRVTVEMQLDRATALPGQSLRATLVASSAREEKVTLLVTLFDASSEPESRVGPPPERVESARVALLSRPGGGPARTLSFAVPAGLDGGLGGRTLAFMVVAERAARGSRSAWLAQQESTSDEGDGGETIAAAVSYLGVAAPATAKVTTVALDPCSFEVRVEGSLPSYLYVSANDDDFGPQEDTSVRGKRRVFRFAAPGCDAEHARVFSVSVTGASDGYVEENVTLPAAPSPAVAAR